MKRNAKANGTVASEEKLNSSTSLSGSRSTSKLSHSQLELNATTKGTSSAVPSAAEQHEMMVRVALAHRLRQNMMETVRRKVQETDQEDSRRVQVYRF